MNRPATCSSVMTRDAAGLGFGKWHEALDLVRHADERVHRLAVACARELQRDREAEIGNERERMRRIDRERRQHREDVVQKVISRARHCSCLRHLCGFDEHDALPGQFLAQFAPARLLVARQHRHHFADARELFGGVRPSGLEVGDARAHLALEAGDAHHEEFVEIVGGDRQKAQPFEQRMALDSPPPRARAD